MTTLNMTTTRIYSVYRKHDAPGAPPRLVRAAHVAQALRHVAADQFSVRVATQDDLLTAITGGSKVEEAAGGCEA